jgi:hypothetical protein
MNNIAVVKIYHTPTKMEGNDQVCFEEILYNPRTGLISMLVYNKL